MATKKYTSVWDMYNSMYNRGMKGTFKNWVDDILHPEKTTRFSLGHLWHGGPAGKNGGIQHTGGKETLFSFKNLFGVKDPLKDTDLQNAILGKGKKIHDYEKYNKLNPSETSGEGSTSHLTSILEYEGKKYANFFHTSGEYKGKNWLYELKNEGKEWTGDSGLDKEESGGKGFKELFKETKTRLLGGKKFKFGIKSDVMDEIKNNLDSLTEEGKADYRAEARKEKKKEKGLKAGLAIADSLADNLRSAWERSYRG